MSEKTAKSCALCGKTHFGRYKRCSGCLKRIVRSKHKCGLCNGRATYDGMVCRKCFWKVYEETLAVLVERRVLREGEYKVEKPVLYG